MFSKTLIKLIDYSIFPAFLIIAAKILGIIFFAKYFGSNFQVSGLKMIFDNPIDFIAINSYSSLIMFAAVIGGLVWVVVKAHVFHDTHITPMLSSRLFSMNMEDIIHTTEVLFSQAFVWLSYAWITTIIFGLHAYFELSYWWIFWGAFGISILATAALAVDMEREISADREKESLRISPSQKMLKLEQIAEEILS